MNCREKNKKISGTNSKQRAIMEIIELEHDRYLKAKKRVEEIKAFYASLTAFIVVNAFLMFVNLMTSPQYLWFLWPFFGWGIGVVFHALKVFNYSPFLGKDWEERKMKEFLEQDKLNKTKWQ